MTDLPPDREAAYSTPSWVKVFVITAVVLVILLVFLMLSGIGGPHGPGRHLPTPTATIEELRP